MQEFLLKVSALSLPLACAILSCGVAALGQDEPTLQVNANVVTLLATVRDRNGRIVNNLTSDDFVLEEDGAP